MRPEYAAADDDAETSPLNVTLEKLATIIATAPNAHHQAAVAEVAVTVARLAAWRLPNADAATREWAAAEGMRRIMLRARELARLTLLDQVPTAGNA